MYLEEIPPRLYYGGKPELQIDNYADGQIEMV